MFCILNNFICGDNRFWYLKEKVIEEKTFEISTILLKDIVKSIDIADEDTTLFVRIGDAITSHPKTEIFDIFDLCQKIKYINVHTHISSWNLVLKMFQNITSDYLMVQKYQGTECLRETLENLLLIMSNEECPNLVFKYVVNIFHIVFCKHNKAFFKNSGFSRDLVSTIPLIIVERIKNVSTPEFEGSSLVIELDKIQNKIEI